MTILILETTFSSLNKAEEITEILVEEKLVRCAQVHPQMVSYYRWNGELLIEKEYPVSYKSQVTAKEGLETRLKELHPYDVPQIIWKEVNTSEDYGQWIESTD